MNREIASYLSSTTSSNWLFEDGSAVAKWTVEENKRFENALALFDKDTPDRWHNVASMIPGKSVTDVIKQYRELVDDVSDIEAGLIPVPGYSANSFTLEWMAADRTFHGFNHLYSPAAAKRNPSSARCNDHERKKGVPWTEEEHRQFLLGLKKYGKGDWRNISRNFVTSRTPTQVASHAQKYFIRQLSGGKDKRRSSIHDITTVNLEEAKSPSPEKEGPDSPQKSSLILQQQRCVDGEVVVRGRYDSELSNEGCVMGFGPSNAALISHLQGTSSSPSIGLNLHHHFHQLQSIDHHGLRLGHHHGTVFQMNPTSRHR
ncbi:transcription factor DIVARICATA-like [Salvia miltiorrhiza]|uniref:transcription factor DIVARICATA-like n=1 Tax=Salvia miltiorrhiza TaxID=226208 RepID=UPI0025AC6D48|nr:transcription factor DIVARICATA-like [Salvia miltiorrhiza]